MVISMLDKAYGFNLSSPCIAEVRKVCNSEGKKVRKKCIIEKEEHFTGACLSELKKNLIKNEQQKASRLSSSKNQLSAANQAQTQMPPPISDNPPRSSLMPQLSGGEIDMSFIIKNATMEDIILVAKSNRLLFVFLAVMLLSLPTMFISYWIVMRRTGASIWAIVIPPVGIFHLAEVLNKPKNLSFFGVLSFFLCFSPFMPLFFNVVFLLFVTYLSVELAKAFGKNISFGLGLILAPMIYYPILSLSKADFNPG
jgi:hypothetical protein